MDGELKEKEIKFWTPEEDSLLREWQGKLGNKWAQVAKHIPGRSGQQCAQRWRHKGNPEIVKARWSEEEDQKLRGLVAEWGNAWAQIARQMPGRTDQQCMGRWRRHLDPGINYGPWRPWEDRRLHDLVREHGAQWAKMAAAFGDRTPQQCRSRWMAICPGAKATVQKRVRTAHSLSPSKIGPPLQRWMAEGDENRPPVANANGKGVRGPPASYPGPFRRPLQAWGCGNSEVPQQRAPPVKEEAPSSPKLPCELHVPRRPRGFKVVLGSTRPQGSAPQQAACSTLLPGRREPLLPPIRASAMPLAAPGPSRGLRLMQQPTAGVSYRIGPQSARSAFHAPYAGMQLLRAQQLNAWQASPEGLKTAALYANVVFFWLQLLMLRPLQPDTSRLDPRLAPRLKQQGWLAATVFLLFCCPCLSQFASKRS